VRALLLDHADPAAGSAAERCRVAQTVALACLGDNHLWQDLQFASRAELSALMRHWFPALVARNHADMKWKKFLYKQLCERAEVLICKAPSCAVCTVQRTRPNCRPWPSRAWPTPLPAWVNTPARWSTTNAA
jgi:nitrogen fixation protein NifQ